MFDADVRPFLLPGTRGTLAAVYYPPIGRLHPAGDVLVVPSFAEEMNRCRAMVSMQARALVRVGVGTLVLDPYGTGESEGSFVEGTWHQWLDDLGRGIAWLRERGNGCRTLWGVRVGALLAADLVQRDPGIERLLLWQPVLNGKTYFTQFLRIRIAAEIEDPNGVKSTDELRRQLAEGQPIEVSGYSIGPELAAAFDRARMPDPAKWAQFSTTWFEVLPSAEASVPRTSTKTVEDLKALNASIEFQSVIGPPFWQVHEREVALDLIEATTHAVESWGSRFEVPFATTAGAWVADAPQASKQPVIFPCGTDTLVGMLHKGSPGARRAAAIVVAGGPQYRAGAHRQFVEMARKLGSNGYPVLRFDLRGMGDSSGTYRGFQHSDQDIRAAIDALLAGEPTVKEVVLIGECESASGILFYAWRDPRVKGVVLINPWVRTEEGRAQVIVKHYYAERLRSPEFWRKVRTGQLDVRASAESLAETVRAFVRGRRMMSGSSVGSLDDDISGLPLPVKTAAGLSRFPGRVMLLMSGRDYIAREFDEVTSASSAWTGLLDRPGIERREMKEADHTFSRRAWKDKASDWIVNWIGNW